MTFFLFSFIFVIFSTFTISTKSTHLFPLLSLNCTSSTFNHTNIHNYTNPIKTLLDNLTFESSNSNFTTLNTAHYSGLMQCRSGLDTKNCTLCAKQAHDTILNLCQSSNSVSAWFDGCYVQISIKNSNSTCMKISNHSCSNKVESYDSSRFEPALETLLLKLRAEVSFATYHGFSHGAITYDNFNRGKIYGLVECVRSLSPKECDICLGKAIEKIYFYCGGKNGGEMVYGMCFVRFDSSEFYYEGVNNKSLGGGVSTIGNYTVLEGESENEGWVKTKVVWELWGGGFGCFVVVVLFGCLLRRTVLNRGKVLSSDEIIDDGKSCE